MKPRLEKEEREIVYVKQAGKRPNEKPTSRPTVELRFRSQNTTPKRKLKKLSSEALAKG